MRKAIGGIVVMLALCALVWYYFFKKPSAADEVAFIKKDVRRRLPNATENELYVADFTIDEFAAQFPDKVDGLYNYMKNGEPVKDSGIQSLIDNILK